MMGIRTGLAVMVFAALSSVDRPVVTARQSCGTRYTSPNRCDGTPKYKFDDSARKKELAEWALKRPWRKPSEATLRIPAQPLQQGQQAPSFTIRAINRAEEIALSQLAGEAMIIARFDVARGTTLDKRYGIGEMAGWDTTFYLVIDDYLPEPQSDRARKSRKVSTWRVYGIRLGTTPATNSFEPVGNHGVFRRCDMTHLAADRRPGARFMTCAGAERLYALQKDSMLVRALARRTEAQGKDLLTALRIETKGSKDAAAIESAFLKILRPSDPKLAGTSALAPLIRTWASAVRDIYADEPTSPAWMSCGTGCCTADDS